MPLGKNHINLSTDHETQLLVQTDGVLVRFEYVQECFVAPRANRMRHVQGEFSSESLSPHIGMSTDRADLDVPRYAKSLAGHRDQTPLPTKADIATQLEGSRQEGSGFGQFREGQHVGAIVRSEWNDFET